MLASWRGRKRNAKECSKHYFVSVGKPAKRRPPMRKLGGLLFSDHGILRRRWQSGTIPPSLIRDGVARGMGGYTCANPTLGAAMSINRRCFVMITPLIMLGVSSCGRKRHAHTPQSSTGPADLNRLIAKYAAIYDVPAPLIHRVVQRESSYNPRARNGPYMGLMQIHPKTARGMGYNGSPEGLLDAETNLKYAVKYLRGAWLVSDGSYGRAVMWYARGYYYEAKRRGMLKQTGLR